MQYIYVLDYSTPSRMTIKVADDVDVSEKIDDNVSGKVHPNMQLVAKKIKDIIENL